MGQLAAGIVVAGFGLALAHAAVAQTAAADDKPAVAGAVWPTDDQAADANEATADDAGNDEATKNDDMKDVDVGKLDWSQLGAGASTRSDGAAADRPVATARPGPHKAQAGGDLSWSDNSKANGAADVSVKETVSPFLDTRVGADMTVARQPTTMSELLSERAANGGSEPQSSGSAWAAITAPGAGEIWDKTAVEARVDPAQEQSKLGASISKSVPLNGQYSLTLQNGYNVTEQGQGMVPVPGLAGRTTRNYETDQSAKLNIGHSGTSLSAGQTLSSGDDKWLRKVGAEQKLFDGVTVSGSIGETAQGTMDKSISAGFKRSW